MVGLGKAMAFAAHDPFASLDKYGEGGQNEHEFEFEETYDGLADNLTELGDDLNDETFGADVGSMDQDFEFSHKPTPPVKEARVEEFRRPRQPPPQPPPQRAFPQPAQNAWNSTLSSMAPQQNAYGKNIPDLQPQASLWGTHTPPPPAAPAAPVSLKKFLSLEEVEAQLLASTQKPSQAVPLPSRPPPQSTFQPASLQSGPPPQSTLQAQVFGDGRQSYSSRPMRQPMPAQESGGFNRPPPPIPQPMSQSFEAPPPQPAPPQSYGTHSEYRSPQMINRPQAPRVAPDDTRMGQLPPMPGSSAMAVARNLAGQQVQQLENAPFAQPPSHPPVSVEAIERGVLPVRQAPTISFQKTVHLPPQSLDRVIQEEESQAILEEIRRSRRAAKHDSRFNGLMSAGDKNFITRIQLQQLVTEDPYAEDFYFQVHSAIQARNIQPQNDFMQTYLLPQGRENRGSKGRRDNPLQRMQQQVQRAVAAAKSRPKATQLALEGALGKISVKTVKNPRQVLRVNKSEAKQDSPGKKQERKNGAIAKSDTSANQKMTLMRIENIYDTLLELEEADRIKPRAPPPGELEDLAAEGWRVRTASLSEKLWQELKVMAPIDPTSTITHPFIAIIDYAKGMRAIPRIMRRIDPEQKLTILTMVIGHLGSLDVVKQSVNQPPESSPSPRVQEEIDTFNQSVLPPLLAFVAESPMTIVTGLLGMFMEQNDIVYVAMSRVGLAFVTMLISRAEIIRQADELPESDNDQWVSEFDTLFHTLEKNYLKLFPVNTGIVNDVYVWQFLASVAVGASMEQQHILVAEVRDKVLDNVISSKTLPPEQAANKIANTNLFLHAMGLDTELLQV